ncbi:porin family protein [uncultured Chryseobacterium sp.]|uniref:porin family protein n=1 Tax=uncultured Chryseobacterium sp. TaxID=259322 RepID=UPI0025F204A3|nr:porin family protein [uncultured Chryseobacterium sp.]
MKKLILGMALAAGSMAFAQTTTGMSSSSPVKFGVKAGINISSISKDGYDDAKSKVGFAGGVFANIPVSEMFSVQPEVMYSQMGSKVSSSSSGTVLGNNVTSTSSATLNLDYVTIPVMLQFRATPAFYIEAGPEFGFLTSAKTKDARTTVVNGSTSTTTSESGDVKDYFSGFNMGVGLGLGYDITPNFGISARYVAGFTDINKKDNNTNGNTSLQNDGNKNRNNTFQGGLYFKF